MTSNPHCTAVWARAALLISLTGAAPAVSQAQEVALPPGNAVFDYQLGGAYAPAADVGIVVRDRLEPAVAGVYNICYVNAFQSQPAERAVWLAEYPSLLLRKDGQLVIDPDWPDELLFDISTHEKREALVARIGPWVDRCAKDGFQAIEPDNLDSWTRSQGGLTQQNAMDFARLLAKRAHAAGLAIGQKNASELAAQGREIGFDFAVAEECEAWSECDSYIRSYGARVYEVEYSDTALGAAGKTRDPKSYYDAACAARGDQIAVIYRDRGVLPRGEAGYLYHAC